MGNYQTSIQVYEGPVKVVEMSHNRLVMAAKVDELPESLNIDSINAVCTYFSKHAEIPIIECFSGSDREFDEFGPGSLWLYEMGCKFDIRLTAQDIILTVTR